MEGDKIDLGAHACTRGLGAGTNLAAEDRGASLKGRMAKSHMVLVVQIAGWEGNCMETEAAVGNEEEEALGGHAAD